MIATHSTSNWRWQLHRITPAADLPLQLPVLNSPGSLCPSTSMEEASNTAGAGLLHQSAVGHAGCRSGMPAHCYYYWSILPSAHFQNDKKMFKSRILLPTWNSFPRLWQAATFCPLHSSFLTLNSRADGNFSALSHWPYNAYTDIFHWDRNFWN